MKPLIKLSYLSASRKTSNLAVLFYFLAVLTLNAQTTTSKIALKRVLVELQEQYKYQFSYADDLIRGISIAPPPEGLNFDETINYLRKETQLTFQYLGNNFIAVFRQKETISICGYVLDKETSTPLDGVTILIGNKFLVTDSFGYFKLENITQHGNLQIRHLGYAPLSISATTFEPDNCQNIYLDPQIEVLSEILLNNYITKGIDKIADGTFDINFLNFGILPGLIETDVLQTVQALPGIQSISETVSDINIRGGTNDQNLILWDDIKVYQAGHFFGLISIFNPQMTKDAKVIKNGTDVAFTDGVSGTIKMNTNSEISKNIRGSIGGNFINLDGFIDAPIGSNSSLQVSSRKAINDLFKNTPTYSKYFDRISQDTEISSNTASQSSFDFYDVSMRWLYQITDRDFLRVSGLLVNNKLTLNESAIFNGLLESKQSKLAQNTIAGSFFYRRNWNPRFMNTFIYTESRYNLDAVNANITDQQNLFQENIVSETSVKLNTFYKYNDQISWLNGYQFTETGITNFVRVDNPVFGNEITEVVREHGLYSQVQYIAPSKSTTLKVGMRYNYIEKFKEHLIEPRISLHYKLNNSLSLDALAEYKHQNSSQIITGQNDFLGIERRRWQLSSLENNIPILKSKQASIGLNYARKGWLISSEGYFKEVNGITSRSQGFVDQYNSISTVGSYKVKGVELLVNKRFKKISAWLSYTYANNTYTFKELAEVNFPNNLDIRHAVNFGSSLNFEALKISAGVNYYSGKPTTDPVQGNEITENAINYQASNSSRLVNYIRVDASMTYNFKLTERLRANAGISIWNGLNHENIINRYYRVDNDQASQISNEALAFTPNISFRVLF